jgi:hypothetical protein
MRDWLKDTYKVRKIPYLNFVCAVAHTFAHTLSHAHKVSPIYTKNKLKGKVMYLGWGYLAKTKEAEKKRFN